MKRWYDEHPEARPFHLEYFGFINASLVGLKFEPVPGVPAKPDAHLAPASEIGPVSGWHAISINQLYGYKHLGDETDQFAYLRQFSPVTRIGYSIVIYHFPVDDANHPPRKLRLEALSQPCSALASQE